MVPSLCWLVFSHHTCLHVSSTARHESCFFSPPHCPLSSPPTPPLPSSLTPPFPLSVSFLSPSVPCSFPFLSMLPSFSPLPHVLFLPPLSSLEGESTRLPPQPQLPRARCDLECTHIYFTSVSLVPLGGSSKPVKDEKTLAQVLQG